MVLLTFVWKCFQDRNFHGVVVGLYEQSIESWVGLLVDKLLSCGDLGTPDFFEMRNRKIQTLQLVSAHLTGGQLYRRR